MILAAVEAALESLDCTGAARVLVACSGGLDSVVLADACVEVRGSSGVALGHIDHAVRSGSDEDAAWVAEFAARLGVEFRVDRLPPGPCDEARLREARYTLLEQQRAATGAERILTAHTRDDQAETVLLRLIRTTRLAGLAGMPRSRGRILRPILGVSRAEVQRYAARRRLSWREDRSNREPMYLRNRIRKELLPLLEARYRAGLRGRLAALAHEAADLTTPQRPATVASNTPAVGGVEPQRTPEISLERCDWTGGAFPDGKTAAVFDARAVPRPIIRRLRPGDRIQPFGMLGRKKVQDVLVDAKVPRAARPWLLVIARPEGPVLWIPQIVRSQDAAVGPDTKDVWMCTCGLPPDSPL